jgi:proteasome lid subunit RPN8/RPN11
VAKIDSATPQEVALSDRHWQIICSHVEACLPEEACGLLAGTGSRVLQVIPVENSIHSEIRYRMDPVEQLRAFQFIEEQGLELIAIFHSHPQGPDRISQTDIAEAYYPETATIIFYPQGREWQARAYKINQSQASEIPLYRTEDL